MPGAPPRYPIADGINQATGSYWLPPWIYPPTEAEPIDDIAYVALPAIGASAVVLTRTIEPGYNSVFLALANNFVGGGWTEGSGSVTWQILIDGAAQPGYDAIPASLGSPANPVRHPSGFRVFESSTVQLIVTNNSVVLAGQLSGGRWQGYFYPKEYEDPSFGGQ
jgi:hypothetical protein